MTDMIESRRGFLSILGLGVIAAPAIVRSASLMKVRSLLPEPLVLDYQFIRGPGIQIAYGELRNQMFKEYVRQNLFTPYAEALKPQWAEMMAET
jgi:hypothetical protein